MAARRDDGTWHGVPRYAIAAAALAVIAVVLVLVSSSSTGLQSCSNKVVGQARYSCYTYYANHYGNASICGYLSGQYRDECLYNVSVSTSNASSCAGIASTAYRASCVSGISASLGSASPCASLGEPYASSCAYGVAESSGFANESLCSSIQNVTLSLSCSASHYYGEALASRDAGYCAYLSRSRNQTELSAMALGQGFSQPLISYSSFNMTPFGYCYSRVALELGNRAMCGSLNGSDASGCQGFFAETASFNATAMRQYCSQSESEYPGITGLCNAAIAIYNATVSGNVTECLGLNGSYRDTCVVDIAAYYNNTAYCSYIANATAEAACNMTVLNGT